MSTKQKENKLVLFVKKFWVYIIAGLLAIAIGVTLGVMAAARENQSVVDVVKPGNDKNDEQNDKEVQPGEKDNDKNSEEENNGEKDNQKEDNTPVSVEPESFALPMTNASVLVDYSDTKLVYNPTLDRWEAHFYVDLTSSDLNVYSVLEGKVLSVDYDYLTGNVIKIEHNDGLVSVYSSLSKEEVVKIGDEVKKGQKIGTASDIAASSSKYGEHLEFTLLKDGKKIDPNNYLDLQSK